MIWIEIIGLAAGTISCASFVPQILKLFRTKNAEGISRRTYIATVTTFALWTLYGALNAQWALIVSNAICLGLSVTILALQIRYARATAAN